MSDPRRASDELLLQMIREGRHDAEIGVRLGISAAEVRERKRALRQRLGEERYAKALGEAQERWTPPWKRRWVLVLAGAFGAIALVLLTANLIVPGDEPIAPVRTVPPATSEPTARVAQTVVLDGETFDDAGAFVSSATTGTAVVGTADNRAGLAVFELAGIGYIQQSEFAKWDIAGGGRGELRLRAPALNGRAVTLWLNAGASATRLRTIRTDVGVIAEVSTPVEAVKPVLLVRAFNDSGQQLLARLSEDGRLHISRQPIPGDWTLDPETGRRIDTAGAIRLGRIEPAPGMTALNLCDGVPGQVRCGVYIRNALRVQLDVGGQSRCENPITEALETPGFVLLIAADRAATTGPSAECQPRGFTAGFSATLGGDRWLGATLPDGSPLGVVATVDGQLFVGQFAPDLGCPCLSLN